MGNRYSCCANKADTRKTVEDKYRCRQTGGEAVESHLQHSSSSSWSPIVKCRIPSPRTAGEPRSMPSCSNLQHISEREPEDADGDPSIHPTTGTIFLTRSKSEIQRNNRMRRKSQYDNQNSRHVEHSGSLKKFSSCSTIFIDDSTVSQPNLKNTIKAVALATYFHIRNRDKVSSDNGDGRLLDIFNERLHPLSKEPVPHDYDQCDPEHKTIYRFIRMLFNAAQLTAECAIVTLVYLERLLMYTEIEIVPANWKRIVFGAILLASKVWDDQAVWNVDYCQIIKDVSVDDLNELERQFLEMLQFNINVPSSVYAKYYFDLRALADAHDLSFLLEQLSKERALKLEAMSCHYENKLRQGDTMRRSHSLDGLSPSLHTSKAILS